MEWFIKQFDNLTNEELYELIKLRIKVFIVEQNCPYHECDGKDLSAFHVMGKEKDEIVAYARILPPDISFTEASLGRVLTRPDYRGMRVGIQLMTETINFIDKQLSYWSLRISAQSYLINFYQKFGFEVVSNEYLEDGIPHIDMLRQP